jgi:formiminotetrahydrofolate cyclodeaminase
MKEGGDLLDARLRDLLTQVADESVSMAGGAATAAAVALAAGLAGNAARRSRDSWAEAGAMAGQADALQARAADLVEQGARAYAEAAARLKGGSDDEAEEAGPQRDWKLGVALGRAADTPLALAETGADIAELCAEVADHCDPSACPDAVAGAMLATAGADAAAHLVEVNLATGPEDERALAAREAAARAAAARERATARGD